MVKCRCGRWTDFSLTCTRCRTDPLSYTGGDYEQEGDTTEELDLSETSLDETEEKED